MFFEELMCSLQKSLGGSRFRFHPRPSPQILGLIKYRVNQIFKEAIVRDELHKRAKEIYSQGDWRTYRAQINKVNKITCTPSLYTSTFILVSLVV